MHMQLSRPAAPQGRADQPWKERKGLTMGLACREVCGMLSIWGGTYGGTIPGIPNGFGLAVSSTWRENKTTVEQRTLP